MAVDRRSSIPTESGIWNFAIEASILDAKKFVIWDFWFETRMINPMRFGIWDFGIESQIPRWFGTLAAG